MKYQQLYDTSGFSVAFWGLFLFYDRQKTETYIITVDNEQHNNQSKSWNYFVHVYMCCMLEILIIFINFW